MMNTLFLRSISFTLSLILFLGVAHAKDAEPLKIKDSLGEIVIDKMPERVAALDMNELDFLDKLGVAVAGTAKDYVPHFLSKYQDDPSVADLGFIVKPNIEKIYALRPDLILITSLQAAQYAEMSKIAPVLHYDVDYRDSNANHIDIVKAHFLTLARIFDKEDIANKTIEALDAKLSEVQEATKDRPERLLILMHNKGAFSAFSKRSRYGFVFDAFGAKIANENNDTGLHGKQVTSEFIQSVNPDIIFVIDRTAVMERRSVLNVESMENPLLRETTAWKNKKVLLVDPEAWYVTAASITPLTIIMDEVINAYKD